ncbi:MAG TPA: PilW family protein [Gammaproteobacteria bacterium]
MSRTISKLRGVTLIELMVALSIGSFLMIGAVTVFMQSRTAFRVTESVSRLQENARFVLDALEPEIRMASYFGLTSRANKIQGRATPLEPTPAGLGVGNDCGPNWSINLLEEVGGSNNGYTWACAAFGDGPQNSADTFVLRRASGRPVLPPLDAGTMYIQSARFQDSQLFSGALIPAGYVPDTSQTHALIVNGYYVSTNSTLDTPGSPIPSLRMKTLVGGALGPRLIDQEVLPGVEDFQVQLGVDTDPVGGANRGSIDRYVNVDDPMLNPQSAGFDPDATVLAVRIWIRLRAQFPENGYTDTTNYVYADRNVPAPNDSFRRTVVSKTIYLRNARTPS